MSRIFLPAGMLDTNSAPHPSPKPNSATGDQIGPLEMECETQATPEPRKIVQIATMPNCEASFAHLYALCDDGTVWEMSTLGDRNWDWVPAIPQGPVA